MTTDEVLLEILEKMPEIRITLDISHWCNVAGSFLQDQQKAVDLAGPADTRERIEDARNEVARLRGSADN